MLEAALVDGITRAGGDACSLGVLPTPGLAGACAATGAAGAMISASHNPYADNGVKLFEAGGRKLRDESEEAVEIALHAILEDGAPVDGADGPGRATVVDDAVDAYVARLITAAGGGTPFTSLHVVLDCAHGAASVAAPAALRALGARVDVVGAEPDGRNINAGCGSTHPELVAGEVVGARVPTWASRSTATPTGSWRSTPTAHSWTATTSWRSSRSISTHAMRCVIARSRRPSWRTSASSVRSSHAGSTSS